MTGQAVPNPNRQPLLCFLQVLGVGAGNIAVDKVAVAVEQDQRGNALHTVPATSPGV